MPMLKRTPAQAERNGYELGRADGIKSERKNLHVAIDDAVVIAVRAERDNTRQALIREEQAYNERDRILREKDDEIRGLHLIIAAIRQGVSDA